MGKLYVVATPIGNLGDITVRALDILRTVDLIAAEDTRVTSKLLHHYQIDTPTTSYHQHTKHKKADALVDLLQEGKNIALVTDAGTPGIQDPAHVLVASARLAGIEVISIPGASAIASAVSISGVSGDQFIFLGFLPKKKGRETLFKNMANWTLPIIIYESPQRVVKTLLDAEMWLGDRGVIIFRELTKKFEEVIQGNLSSVISQLKTKLPKGEFVIMILPNNKKKHGREKNY